MFGYSHVYRKGLVYLNGFTRSSGFISGTFSPGLVWIFGTESPIVLAVPTAVFSSRAACFGVPASFRGQNQKPIPPARRIDTPTAIRISFLLSTSTIYYTTFLFLVIHRRYVSRLKKNYFYPLTLQVCTGGFTLKSTRRTSPF